MMRFEKATGGWVAFKTGGCVNVKIADIQMVHDAPFVTMTPQLGMMPGSAIRLLSAGVGMLIDKHPKTQTMNLDHVGHISYFTVEIEESS